MACAGNISVHINISKKIKTLTNFKWHNNINGFTVHLSVCMCLCVLTLLAVRELVIVCVLRGMCSGFCPLALSFVPLIKLCSAYQHTMPQLQWIKNFNHMCGFRVKVL